jgi:hypothetical protein
MSALRVAFAEWLLDPYRNPPTQKEWAEQHDLDAATLSDWKRREDVRALLAEWRERYRPAFVDVVYALFRRARAGDVQAARLLGDWLGENARARVDHEVVDRIAYVDPDALRQLSLEMEGSPQALPERTGRT